MSEKDGIKSGWEIIKDYVRTLDHSAGVYRMLSARDEVLYVGKARSLKKRVASYAKPSGHNKRIENMIAQTARMMFITTQTETEALLLEQNLIKQLKPRYNILLRDDKSFPEILIRQDHEYPQILRHRGTHKAKGKYFGPFASGSAVNRTLHHLERAFMLRTCTDSDFKTRSRPCLQYQIKRCSAPCVGYISQEDYNQSVSEAIAFMEGKSQDIQKHLADEMKKAAQDMAYEKAASIRDRLAALTSVQQGQNINPETTEEADIIALSVKDGLASIQIFFIRSHQNWGNHAYFPRSDESDSPAEILEAFIAQFYAKRVPPQQLLLSDMPANTDLLREALSAKAGKNVVISVPQRGEKLMLVGEALRNAHESAARKLATTRSLAQMRQGLADRFSLSTPPERIEVYDNSHIQGAHAVGAMIVSGPEGFIKSHYRKYNIKSENISAGDDFAMMDEVLSRRFKRLSEENTHVPDLILIDGGSEQLKRAENQMKTYGFDIPIIGVAKGTERDAGREEFYKTGQAISVLPKNDPVLHFIQRLRDEAHRFAIGTHRAKRSAAIKRTALDDIPGIGSGRKRALLHHFGSAKAVKDAKIEDLRSVHGISNAMAETIYGYFRHDQS